MLLPSCKFSPSDVSSKNEPLVGRPIDLRAQKKLANRPDQPKKDMATMNFPLEKESLGIETTTPRGESKIGT